MPVEPQYDRQVSADASQVSEAAQPTTVQEISLLDILVALAARKWLIAKFTFVCAVLAVVLCLLMSNVYTGKTTILPPQQTQSIASSMVGQFGGLLAGLAGKDFIGKSQSEMFVAMLQSRGIEEALVQRFNLVKVYKAKFLVDACRALEGHSKIEITKQGLIAVAVEDLDPQRAADIANGYIEELQKLTGRLAIGEAGQRRLFFEKQLLRAKDDLTDAEIAFRQTQERTGVMQIDAQSRAIIAAVSQLKAEIAAKEVTLQAMRSFATEQNPDYRLNNEQLAGLQQQLAKLLRNSNTAEGDIEIPTTKIPTAGLEYIRRFRELKYQETLYELFARQYEIARVDEAKSAPVIQVVDWAKRPERKSSPFRTLIVLLSTMAAFFFVSLFVLLKEMYRRQRQDPGTREKLDLLRLYASAKHR